MNIEVPFRTEKEAYEAAREELERRGALGSGSVAIDQFSNVW